MRKAIKLPSVSVSEESEESQSLCSHQSTSNKYKKDNISYKESYKRSEVRTERSRSQRSKRFTPYRLQTPVYKKKHRRQWKIEKD